MLRFIICCILFYFMPDTIANGIDGNQELPRFRIEFLNKGVKINEDISFLSSKNNVAKYSYFSFTENDVKLYHWPSQTLVLKKEAINRLMERLESLIKERNYDIKKEKGNGVFAVMLDNTIMYLGLIIDGYNSFSNHPVMRIRHKENISTINIRPNETIEQDAYQAMEYHLRKTIEKVEIKKLFYEKNKLSNKDDPECVKSWRPTENCFIYKEY